MAEKPAPDLDALLRYRQKRTFDKTPEPEAGAPAESGDLTFVIQQHAATRMHWDFRLEVDGVLASWAVPRGPSLNPKDKRMAADGAAAGHPAAREAPFPDSKSLRPMLATPLAAPFSKAGWIFEPKLDGVRTLAFVRDGKVELRSRRGNLMTVQYPDVCEALA